MLPWASDPTPYQCRNGFRLTRPDRLTPGTLHGTSRGWGTDPQRVSCQERFDGSEHLLFVHELELPGDTGKMKTYFCAKTFNSERDKDGLPLSHPQYLDFCLAKIWLWQPLRDRVPGWGPHAAVG